jgi:hypothetical protein
MDDGSGVSIPDTLRYDLVNVGREVLAKISNGKFNALAKAKTAADVATAGAALKDIAVDVDALPCSGSPTSHALLCVRVHLMHCCTCA